jgi:excisionase family DNA binding protein
MKDQPAAPEFFTVSEAARRLRVEPLTIYRRIHRGDLEARRLGPHGPLRIEAAALDRFAAPVRQR